MLFSEPKIPQSPQRDLRGVDRRISVLFSEPKIPQFNHHQRAARNCGNFSALQRAENSSIVLDVNIHLAFKYFSALQRAENSSIRSAIACGLQKQQFQCSSASRKFLNVQNSKHPRDRRSHFSALQRAENSSINRARSAARVV